MINQHCLFMYIIRLKGSFSKYTDKVAINMRKFVTLDVGQSAYKGSLSFER